MSPERETITDSTTERRFDIKIAAPFLITIIAGAICYGLLVNRGLGLPILGYNVSPAERLLHGEAPYRDFIYNYTPGVLWLNALVMKMFGASLMAINWALFAFKLAALAVLFLIARRIACRWAALVPVALALAWIGYRVVFRVYPTQYSMLFILLAIVFLLNYDRAEKLRWLFACGLMTGAVFLFKHNVGLYALITSTAALAIREIIAASSASSLASRLFGALKKSSVLWSGFAIIAAAMAIYLASAGALQPMLKHFFSLAGEYGDKRSIALPPIKLLAPIAVALIVTIAVSLLAIRWTAKLLEPFLIAVLLAGSILLLVPGKAYVIKDSATAAVAYFPLTLFALTFALLSWQFARHRRSDDERKKWWRSFGSIIIIAALAFAAYLEMYPRADYAHLVRVLPPVFLLLFALVACGFPALANYFKGRLPAPRRAALVCVAVPIVFLTATGIKDAWQPRFDSSFRFTERTPLNIARASGILVTRRQAEFANELAEMIESNSLPDEYIFSFAPRGTAFYFLSARRNPTRFVWWRSVGINKSEREAFLNDVAAQIPKLILIPDGFDNERIKAQVEAAYHRVGGVGDIAVYARNESQLATPSDGR